MRPIIPITCKHDGDAGLLRNGQPRCPMCRREAETQAAVAAPGLDHAALAANDTTLWDE